MSECTHDCSSCGENCSERKAESFLAPQNQYSNIKKVYAVVSGKGGVGKSMVTSILAIEAAKKGKKVAIMDADITGPSIPKIFGLRDKAISDDKFIYPLNTALGIKVISINSLIPDETDPVVWRGPVIAGCVKQFWTDVVWDEIDEMYIDCPPGTGDVPLTIFQSIPVNGIIVVTTPQSLVSMVVTKAVKMAKMMNINILGIVENMSYFKCDECGKEHKIFGESNIEAISKEFGIDNIAKLPINPRLPEYSDQGILESLDFEEIRKFQSKI